jgi:hypothetical protein
METERRTKPRVKVAHEFTVNHRDLGQVVCATRDLSLTGVFVEGDFTSLIVGVSVDIRFAVPSSLPGAGAGKAYALSAVVMRITNEGAGLRFIDPDMETSSALVKLMYG